jgi:arabinoxylan arabinofuranohydrolase
MIHKLIILILVMKITLSAQNPIVPPGLYIADPTARVWNDGKLYIYGSADESTEYYCSYRYHVMETGDLKTWIIHENRFASRGENDQVPYSNHLLYAPSCMYHNGLYYLYYCQPDPENAEGVAVSESPTGPFRDGRPVNTHGYNEIDPNVFIDDDGTAYYVWGQFTLKMAKLKNNMIELDETTISDSVLTESEHFFHEGAFMTKRDGLYYLVYSDMSRSSMPTCIGYATSSSPSGPYKYGGVIIDNNRSDPGVWNNHGSIAEFNGQWYVFYHRSTHNSKKMRKVCVEPISFEENGSIREVEMTSQGAGGPLPAKELLGAERACQVFGNVRIQRYEHNSEELGEIKHNDRAVFKYIDFGEGVDRVIMRVRPGNSPGVIALKLGMPWRPDIGVIRVPGGDGKAEYITLEADIKDASGIHALWLQFWGDDNAYDLNWAVDWLKFE